MIDVTPDTIDAAIASLTFVLGRGHVRKHADSYDMLCNGADPSLQAQARTRTTRVKFLSCPRWPKIWATNGPSQHDLCVEFTLPPQLARPKDVADDPERVCCHPLIERISSHICLLCLAALNYQQP